jgi:hypothetical protein
MAKMDLLEICESIPKNVKKAANHRHSVALHYMFYNFCRVHQKLKVSPAMEAGLTDHVWSLEELCALMPKPVVKASKIEKNMLLKAMGKSEKPA